MLASRWFGSVPPVQEEQQERNLKDDIDSNPTVFGELLRGEAPVRCLYDDDEYFAFKNIKPYAPLAGLVISKRFVLQDPDGLTVKHLPLIRRLREIAYTLIDRHYPNARDAGDFRLRFHRPPFNSVSHLHLHVLAPASAFPLFTHIVFAAPTPWAVDVDDVIDRLQAEQEKSSPPDDLVTP